MIKTHTFEKDFSKQVECRISQTFGFFLPSFSVISKAPLATNSIAIELQGQNVSLHLSKNVREAEQILKTHTLEKDFNQPDEWRNVSNLGNWFSAPSPQNVKAARATNNSAILPAELQTQNLCRHYSNFFSPIRKKLQNAYF